MHKITSIKSPGRWQDLIFRLSLWFVCEGEDLERVKGIIGMYDIVYKIISGDIEVDFLNPARLAYSRLGSEYNGFKLIHPHQ